MKNLFAGLATGLMLFGFTHSVSATVLDFDTLSGGSNLIGVYGDFTWENMYSYQYSEYNTLYQNTLSPLSGNIFAFNGFGTSASLTDNADFDFNGVYLTGWVDHDDYYSSATAQSVTIKGYDDGALVSTYIASLTLNVMNYFNVGMLSVDQLTFEVDGSSKWFLMDNFSYNEQQPVPEPATMILFGTGLAGLAAAGRRKKH